METQYGPALDVLPEGFVHRSHWPEYQVHQGWPPPLKAERVGAYGIRWGLCPLYVEEYVGDEEPDLSFSDALTPPNRFIRWFRPTRRDNPGRPWRTWKNDVSRIEGFIDLGAYPDYRSRWSESMRRYSNRWRALMASGAYAIEEVTPEVFASAYRRSVTARRTPENVFKATLRKASNIPDNVTFWLASDTVRRSPVGGMAVLNSPSCRSSYYANGFYFINSNEVPAMAGLMDHWCAASLAKGYRYLDLGGLWRPGDPKEWKGFSTFKAKLRPHIIAMSPLLVQFRRGTFVRKIIS